MLTATRLTPQSPISAAKSTNTNTFALARVKNTGQELPVIFSGKRGSRRPSLPLSPWLLRSTIMSSSVGKFPPPFSTLIINFNTLVRQKNTLPEGLPISALTFRRICTSAIWSQYLEGILPQEDAFKQLAEHFHLSTLTIEEAFTAARSNFQIDKQLLDTLNVVKATGCMIYIISNGDQDVKSFLSLAPEIDEALLDGIMTSYVRFF